jgi:hypothetical protein
MFGLALNYADITQRLINTCPEYEHLLVDLYLVASKFRNAALIQGQDFESNEECNKIVTQFNTHFSLNCVESNGDILLYNNDAELVLIETCFTNPVHMGRILGYFDPLDDIENIERYLVSFVACDLVLMGQISSFPIQEEILTNFARNLDNSLKKIGITATVEPICEKDDITEDEL